LIDGLRVAARVGELQAAKRSPSAFAPNRSRCAATSVVAQAGDRRLRPRVEHELIGLARPSCWTATASPPQISFAPLQPKRCQRRRVRSLGSPSAVPSQPSIGRMQKRLPTRTPSSSNGRASGDAPRRRARRRTRARRRRPADAARNASAVFSDATRG
jgi:hypothetical protein